MSSISRPMFLSSYEGWTTAKLKEHKTELQTALNYLQGDINTTREVFEACISSISSSEFLKNAVGATAEVFCKVGHSQKGLPSTEDLSQRIHKIDQILDKRYGIFKIFM